MKKQMRKYIIYKIMISSIEKNKNGKRDKECCIVLFASFTFKQDG